MTDYALKEQEYKIAAKKAIDEEREDIKKYVLDYCPECGTTTLDDGHHYYYSTDWNDFCLIGCEGYWVINPNLLGIPSPNWSDANGE